MTAFYYSLFGFKSRLFEA